MVTSEDLKKWQKAYLHFTHQKDDLVKDKQSKIANELNLIPESDFYKRYTYLDLQQKKNLDEKHQNEFNEKVGKKHPVVYIGQYYSEIDKWLKELIAMMYEKLLPFEKKEVKLKEELNTRPELTNLQLNTDDVTKTPMVKIALDDTSNEASYTEFKELFTDSEQYKICIDALIKVRPPVVDSNMRYLLGSHSKGSIVAFVAALKYRGKIESISDKTMASLLNKEIKGLDIDERSLRNPTSTNYKKYYNPFLALIPQ